MKILYELYFNREMACIYANCNDTSKFLFGRIIAVNEENLVIQMISPDAENDGITVISVNNVNRVETNSQYVKKMKKLYHQKVLPVYDLQIEDGNIIMGVLMFAFKEREIVSLELLDSGYNDIVGLIEEVDDTECRVQQFDEYGNPDGISYFRINDVSKIAVSTQDEKRIMRLSKTGDGSLC